MTSEVVAVSQSLNIMINAQNKYILSKIRDEKYKAAYLKLMNDFIKVAAYNFELIDFRMYLDAVKDLKRLERQKEQFQFIGKYTRSAIREGEDFAISVVEDIVNSLETRFINGGHRLHEGLLDKYVTATSERFLIRKKKVTENLKITIPTLSRRAIIEDEQLLVKQIKSTLDKIKTAIKINKNK